MRAIENNLVRSMRRNSNDISGREFLPDAALYGAVALFVRRNGLSVDERTTDNERRRT